MYKARMGEGGRDEEASSEKKTELKTRGKNRYPIYDQTAEKPYPLWPHIPI